MCIRDRRHLYGAMGQLKGWCRTQPAWREQQSLGLRDRIEARAAGKFSDVELERQAHVAYWQILLQKSKIERPRKSRESRFLDAATAAKPSMADTKTGGRGLIVIVKASRGEGFT